MTKAQLETKLRNTFLNFVTEQIQTAFDTDVLAVSASELARRLRTGLRGKGGKESRCRSEETGENRKG